MVEQRSIMINSCCLTTENDSNKAGKSFEFWVSPTILERKLLWDLPENHQQITDCQYMAVGQSYRLRNRAHQMSKSRHSTQLFSTRWWQSTSSMYSIPSYVQSQPSLAAKHRWVNTDAQLDHHGVHGSPVRSWRPGFVEKHCTTHFFRSWTTQNVGTPDGTLVVTWS